MDQYVWFNKKTFNNILVFVINAMNIQKYRKLEALFTEELC